MPDQKAKGAALRWLGAVLTLWLLSGGVAQGGLYNTAEPYRGPTVTASGVEPMTFSEFRSALEANASIGSTLQETAQRKHYLEKSEELLRKERSGGLSTQDKVNLSEYLIRLGKVEEAVQLLTPLSQGERNFMVFANLATAHQLAGRLDRAAGCLAQVKDDWPREWPGLTKEQLDWYRQVEKYHLRLVLLRNREAAAQRGARQKGAVTLDEIFSNDQGPVLFVGDSGQYEAGKIAAREKEKLPKDAIAIVQQLLLWIPGGPGLEDTRLYWLLGELYNARNFPGTAKDIFNVCVFSRGYTFPEIREHQKIVRAALPAPASVAAKFEPPSQTPPASLPAPETRPMNMHHVVLIGGVAGVVVLGLIFLQVRELRRRRKSEGR